ncbi:MAG: hypothetical protein JXR37_31045 [Kiritimatiellae bacterium]|nr:hypothetical protein [Kiritimatiellia bacterium]
MSAVRIWIVLALAAACVMSAGCATPGSKKPGDVYVSLTPGGKILFLEQLVSPETFARQLKRRGFRSGTVVNISIRPGAPRSAAQRVYAVLAKHGYRNVLFKAPQRAVVVPGPAP